MNRPRNEVLAAETPSAGSVQVPCWKRTLDTALVLMTLPVVLPLMILIGVGIRVVSAGPVLFRQQRVGHLGKPFTCLKFRTMAVNADTTVHQGHLGQLMGADVPMVKMDQKGDPRLIRFGVLLRSSGLDELPQLLNVLRGEMSLVGPRPCVPYECEAYEPWHRGRFEAVPGLTGLWQVSGKNRTTFEEMVLLDIEYAKRLSLCLDLEIILKTLPAIWGQYC